MKVILYAVFILITCGGAFFSYSFSNKFAALQQERLETIEKNKQTTASADAADTEIAKLKKTLEETEAQQLSAEQALASAKSAGSGLTSNLVKLDEEVAAQDEEFAQLDKTLKEVGDILKDLGGDINLDNLPAKIQQIEDDKKAKTASLEELETLVSGADKSLTGNRAELDRLVKKIVDRSSRISRNSMEAVVTAVNQDWGFLVIGAGSNSGFTPQTALLVERDGRRIARVRPSSIEPTQTIAEIDPESLAAGVRLQPGDRVILAQPTSN